MKNSLSQHLYIFYSLVFIIYIINVFVGSEKINYIVGLLAILMLGVSFTKASRLFQILASAFLFIGGFFYFQSGESIVALPSVLTSNMLLLVLLAMLPWMNSVVRSGGFDRHLNELMKVNVSDLGILYVRSSTTILILGAFLNLSAATISQDILKKNLSYMNKKLRDSFISMSTLRGFTIALLWSPLEILLATSIFVTDVTYASVLPWLLLIALVTFILDSLWGRFHFKKYSYVNQGIDGTEKPGTMGLKKKIAHLGMALVLFLALVIIIGNIFKLDFILTVAMLIFPFALVWSMFMKRTRRFLLIGWDNWKQKTNTMQNFIILFISLSLFSHSIGNTTFLEYIQQPLMNLSEHPLLVFFFIQLLFIGLSMFGIHPIATIGILTSLLSSLLTIYNPISIAIVMITSSVATLAVGTYGLVVTLTAVNLDLNPYRITFGNLIYALIFGSVGSITAFLLL